MGVIKPLTAEKLNRMIDQVRENIKEKIDPTGVESFEKEMAIDFEEHFKFQELQSHAHVQGVLSTDAAMIVYVSLGEVGSEENGGWATGTDLATKVVVTQLMGELLSMKIAGVMV